MLTRKAQSGMEFVVLFTFMVLAFFVFFFALQNMMVEATQAQDVQILSELNDIVTSEIRTAQSVYADYERLFTLPSVGLPSDLSVHMGDPYEVSVRYGVVEYVTFFPEPIVGQILYGVNGNQNFVFKTDGVARFADGSTFEDASFAGVFLNVNPELCYVHNITDTCSQLESNYNILVREFCALYTSWPCGS